MRRFVEAWYTVRLRQSHCVAITVQFALGVGVAGGVAASAYAFVARPLPFPDGRAIVQVQNSKPGAGALVVTDREFDDGWSRMTGPFEGIAAFSTSGANAPLVFAGATERLRVCAVAGDLFGVLGVSLQPGRSFSRQELHVNAPVAIISEAVWRDRFGGRVDALGGVLRTDRGPYTVIGVVPYRQVFPADTDVWVPRIPFSGRGYQMTLVVVARLRPGWSPNQAAAAVAPAVLPVRPGGARPSIRLERLVNVLLGGTRQPLLGATLVAALALTAVLVNLLHFTMARALARQREFAIRLALGATVGSLRRVALVDLVITCAPGMLAGCLMSYWLIRVLLAIAPRSYSVPPAVLDAAALIFNAAVYLIFVPTLALASAGQAVHDEAATILRSGHGAGDVTLPAGWRSKFLIASETALTVALVVIGVAFTRSFVNVDSWDLGYRWDNLITFRMELPRTRYPNSDARRLIYDAIRERLRTVPFASAVEASAGGLLAMAGTPVEPTEQATRELDQRWVTPGFLAAIGVPVVEGRHLQESDRARDVAVVNAAYVQAYLGGGKAVGRMVPFGTPREIVGVVPDVRDRDIPVPQGPVGYMPMTGAFGAAHIVMRLREGAVANYSAIRRAVADVDSDIAIGPIQTVADRVDIARGPWKARAILVALAAGTTLVVLCAGLLAVLWHAMARERQPIAIRLALGARPRHVALHIRRALDAPLIVGTCLGLWGGWVLQTMFARQIYGISRGDVLAYVVSALSVIGLATFLPLYVARHATRMNVSATLRSD